MSADDASGSDGRGTYPITDPVAELPQTAQRILSAARKLLAERGYPAITLENVAAEAGVNKASIRYNFGNKAGLIASLVDSMLHEEFENGVAAVSTTPHEDLVRALVESKRHVIRTTQNFRGFFDILPHAVRDEDLRRRMAASYPWWAEQNLRMLELEGSGPERRHAVLQGLGRLISALTDGLSVQAGLESDDFDMDAPMAAAQFLLECAMPELERMAAEDAAEAPSRAAAAATTSIAADPA